ncbi:RNA polymerase sigma factor [Chitinophaga pinensis]|uniref:RNA polymerase, sigma-24 subunit, ECF subfamily n=1 Tax=Chitinophaga pinensis (strain ATCC 43595 / DSM 2588 / LMG 13176 / NBRC 15968 / NCIMB 11800 / UQM 2034) TaxID=485918 RepID=A0A979GXG0_CHIPD|nr:sigma-70 family RNA polymerase sigma factor [Chitinophaga pinensis]ACU62421.1 RNA polymerase, sigma-24 subunit, ECF subfamily [Chitinophaga pinensis DSM 2588]
MDETQFLQLIEQHQQIIHKICWLYRDSPEDREDLFQEIVCQLWKSAPSFEGRSRFSSWLYRIAINTALTAFRRKQPDLRYPSVLPDMPAGIPDDNEQMERLRIAIRQLNDTDKAIITLYLEELSYQEIAAITGMTENNVGVKINRIKNKLHQLLQQKK